MWCLWSTSVWAAAYDIRKRVEIGVRRSLCQGISTETLVSTHCLLDILSVDADLVDLGSVTDVVLARWAVRWMVTLTVHAFRRALLLLRRSAALLRLMLFEALHTPTWMSTLGGGVSESLAVVALGDALVRAIEAFPAHTEVSDGLGSVLNVSEVHCGFFSSLEVNEMDDGLSRLVDEESGLDDWQILLAQELRDFIEFVAVVNAFEHVDEWLLS